jgi:DNA-binding MarR family transcriptional regulator
MGRAGRRTGVDGESTAVLVALRRIVRYLRLADRAAESACDLSAAQLFVLRVLSENPGMSLAELARTTVTDQSSVSTVVARLVARRYVQRRPSANDRRRAELRVTASGARVLRTAPSVPQREMIAAIRAMSAARRRELVRALEGLVMLIGAGEIAPRMLFEDER